MSRIAGRADEQASVNPETFRQGIAQQWPRRLMDERMSLATFGMMPKAKNPPGKKLRALGPRGENLLCVLIAPFS
jgi:hypothetical protein